MQEAWVWSLVRELDPACQKYKFLHAANIPSAAPKNQLGQRYIIEEHFQVAEKVTKISVSGSQFDLTSLSSISFIRWSLAGLGGSLTTKGNGKPLQYTCFENPMNSMKGQKDRTLKDELPRSVGSQYAMGDQWRNNSTKNERWSQSKNSTQLWVWLVMGVKSDAVKNNIA